VTLFGLFYFDPPTQSGGETLTQAQQLKQCFEIDVYTSNETVMFGYEGRPARVSAKIEALRPRFNAANDYLARTRHRFPDGKLPDNVQKACLKAQAVVEEMNSLNTRSIMSFSHIVDYVAAYYNLTVDELKSEKRSKEISLARQMLMVIAKAKFQRTFEKIGNYF
jgi:hypothetical protein